MRDAAPVPGDGLRIALTVAAPSAKVASRWGDWHLAQAFARSLRKQGHVVRVQTFDQADDLASRASDVHCVLRGLRAVRRSPGQAHVLWIISHPDTIDAAECDGADLVLVASRRFAEELRGRTRTPVEVMLQATDATRFHPMSADPRHSHDVAVVAKSRDVYRTAVADAISAGLRPAIYGSGWDGLIDPALIAGEYVANEELPVVYSSIGVLLNDHWRDMREHGFVSNRLFDALASGTPVISDDVPEIAEIFGDVVSTYHDPVELRSLVEATLADPAAARERAARGGELVRERHTFDQRAVQFSESLKRHGLDREPGTRSTP
jgi:glycosyltransferase involved in cell wall biosynthesis